MPRGIGSTRDFDHLAMIRSATIHSRPRVGITGHLALSPYNVDQYPFSQRGYAAAFVFEYLFSRVHHTPQDSTGYVNIDYAARMIKATLATICAIANEDFDADGASNSLDNCATAWNPDQSDIDGDKIGDACDSCPECPCDNDPICDGVRSDIQDVVSTLQVAFRGEPPARDSTCLRERSDVDCSGATDIVDVVKVIDVAFRGAALAATYCDPYAP
jgi:hypothetical protein